MSKKYSDDAEAVNVCAKCIGDKYLREEIEEKSDPIICSYCGKTGNGTDLKNLGERIHAVLDEQFYLTSTEPSGIETALAKDGLWERSGDLVSQVIAEIAGLDESVAEDIRESLSDYHGYSAVKDGDDDPYAEDACYQERKPDDINFRDTWESFCQQIRWRSRFFSQYAEIDLDNIFGNLENLKTREGHSAVLNIRPNDYNHYVYRARIAFAESELETILKFPAKEIGAPPPRLAKAGRMNAAGISVFYGAKDVDTCIAEVRAPVGSSVVIGRFSFIRPVRLLDLNALTEIAVEGSYFDSEFLTLKGRAIFLRHLVQVISRPIMPSDEVFEYLPTQVISEYLASRVNPPIDGLIFHSSQTGDVGQNVVLFNHASITQPDDVPVGTKFSFYGGSGPDDDYDETIAIFEEIPPPIDPLIEEKKNDIFGFLSSESDDSLFYPKDDEVWLKAHQPTLKLDNNYVSVLNISGVKYTRMERSVLRSRFTREEK